MNGNPKILKCWDPQDCEIVSSRNQNMWIKPLQYIQSTENMSYAGQRSLWKWTMMWQYKTYFFIFRYRERLHRNQESAVEEALKAASTWCSAAQAAQLMEQHKWVLLGPCGCSHSDSAFEAPSYGSGWEIEVHSLDKRQEAEILILEYLQHQETGSEETKKYHCLEKWLWIRKNLDY